MSKDKMTPHDELMALAGKATPGEWETAGVAGQIIRAAGSSLAECWLRNPHQANAAFIAAACNFVRSDAFRAMVMDAGRWQHYAASPQTALALGTKLNPHDPDVDWAAECNRLSEAAIDAAASGAGE